MSNYLSSESADSAPLSPAQQAEIIKNIQLCNDEIIKLPASSSIDEKCHLILKLATLYYQFQKYTESLQYCSKISTSYCKLRDAYIVISKCYRQLQNMGSACEFLLKAIDLEFSVPVAFELAYLANSFRKYHISNDMYKRILEVEPLHYQSLNNYGKNLKLFGFHEESLTYLERALYGGHQQTRDYLHFKKFIHSNLILNYLYSDHADYKKQYECTKEYKSSCNVQDVMIHPVPTSTQKLRNIGYISCTFDNPDHAINFFMKPILLNHDTSKYKIFCYQMQKQKYDNSYIEEIDGIVYRNLTGVSDTQAAEIMYNDNLDICVDLMAHASDTRLSIMCAQIAKIQASYCAYPGTTGIPEIKYKIVDTYCIGKDMDKYYIEELIKLPNGYHCFMPNEHPDIIKNNEDKKDGTNIIFGCFNNLAKITGTTMKTWATIINTVPNSKLLIRHYTYDTPDMKEMITKRFEDAGLPRDKLIIYGPYIDTLDVLRLYNNVDIALDPFPYTGTTTTCEALYMGCPVVTLVGEMCHERMGYSLIACLNDAKYVEKCVSYNINDYIKLAVNMASDAEFLTYFRSTIRDRIANSIIGQPKKITEQFEEAYEYMWEKHKKENASTMKIHDTDYQAWRSRNLTGEFLATSYDAKTSILLSLQPFVKKTTPTYPDQPIDILSYEYEIMRHLTIQGCKSCPKTYSYGEVTASSIDTLVRKIGNISIPENKRIKYIEYEYIPAYVTGQINVITIIEAILEQQRMGIYQRSFLGTDIITYKDQIYFIRYSNAVKLTETQRLMSPREFLTWCLSLNYTADSFFSHIKQNPAELVGTVNEIEKKQFIARQLEKQAQQLQLNTQLSQPEITNSSGKLMVNYTPKIFTYLNELRQTTRKLKIHVEGWRGIVHSYAIVSRMHCLPMMNNPNIELTFSDMPYYRPHWGNSVNRSDVLFQIPALPEGQQADVVLRIMFPYDYRPSPKAPKTVVFTTSEKKVLEDSVIISGKKPLADNVYILTPSMYSKLGIMATGYPENRVIMVPHGVNPELFKSATKKEKAVLRAKYNIPANEFVFLNVSALSGNKSINMILEKFAEVQKQFVRCTLIIKSSKTVYEWDLYEHYIKPMNLPESVTKKIINISNVLTDEEMANLHRLSDCYVSPYTCEAFNIPAMEAMFCKNAVICTQGGPTDEFIPKEIMLFVPANVLKFQITNEADKIRDLSGNVIDQYILQPDPNGFKGLMEYCARHALASGVSVTDYSKYANVDSFIQSYSMESVTNHLVDELLRISSK
jgi:protein O-GlcNAc transferase